MCAFTDVLCLTSKSNTWQLLDYYPFSILSIAKLKMILAAEERSDRLHLHLSAEKRSQRAR